MKPLRAFLACLLFLVCLPARAAEPGADARFEAIANGYIEKLLRAEPERATRLGDHRFDDRLNDRTPQGTARVRALAQETLARLKAVAPAELSRANNIDYRILASRLEYAIFSIDELRENEWNPLRYNVANAIYELVARDFAPLDQRIANVAARLRQVPAVLEAAKANLRHPPRVYTETAILQNKGAIVLIRGEVTHAAGGAPAMKEELGRAQEIAVAALEDYGRWLEQDLLPRSDGEFRLGEARYRRKLAFELDSDLTMEQILARARADLARTQHEMYEAALPLYRRYYPERAVGEEKAVVRAVLDRLAQDKPTNDTIVPRARESLERTTRFVREHGLVTVPDDPIEAIVMPEFDRGVAVAYCRAAPPLEPHGRSYFAISPTPANWSAARVDSFFREYNDHMVEDLTIHEAMPGHYLQLMHASRFKAPTLVRTVFRSGPFIEGWAVYGEQVMAESGYGGPEVRMQQLKMRARAIINAIMDQGIHAGAMTERDAMALMMGEGFQEEGEAAGKWRRAQLSSAQLSTYYVGLLGVTDIRRAYEAKAGGKMDLRRLHDTMLSFGDPAPKYVRELMGLAPAS